MKTKCSSVRIRKLTGVVVAFTMEVELSVLAEESLTVLLFMSIDSGLMGGCDMTIGCGALTFDEFMIGLIWVDPTFIVDVVDCCIVLPKVAVFSILAMTETNHKCITNL